MKSFGRLALGCSLALGISVFTGCSGDASSSIEEWVVSQNESSSSVVTESSAEQVKSSSEKVESSSEVVEESSSAADELESSSEALAESSSDVAPADKPSWQFLNPEISYDEFVDERDGQPYKSVKIGTQTWMAENLNYAYSQPSADMDSTSACYRNVTENCDKYGRLYLYSAMLDSAGVFSEDALGCGRGAVCELAGKKVRGVCPEGWRLPSKAEWNTLIEFVDKNHSGAKLRSKANVWMSSDHAEPPEDAYGFSLLPSGYYSDYNGKSGFEEIRYLTDFFYYDVKCRNDDLCSSIYFLYRYEVATESQPRSRYMLPIRCIKDED